MSLKINHNLEAMDTLRNLTTAQGSFSQSMQRLSSGKRINSAADDAAGYAISNKLMAQSKGLDQAQANSQDGISMIQTASGGLQTIQNLLQRFRQLAVQSANDTNTTSDRQALQAEGNQISQEITQIATTTQFNTKNLLDGTLGSTTTATGTMSMTGTYNGAALSLVNGPTANAGTLNAGLYQFSVTTVGKAATTTAVGASTGSLAGGIYLNDGVKGIKADGVTPGTGGSGLNPTNFTLSISGSLGSTQVTIALGGTTASTGDTWQNVLDKINAFTGQTGVSATLDATKGLVLTNNQAGSNQAVTVSGDDHLMKNLGLVAGAAFTTGNDTVSASGTDGVATLTGVSGNTSPTTITAKGNVFSDATSGFKYDLSSVTSLSAGSVNLLVNSNAATLQVGANANQNLTVSVGDMRSTALGIQINGATLDITTQSNANNAISIIDSAIQVVSTQASTLGAVQNRLTAAIGNLSIGSENMTAAYSAITDVNMAQESTSLATAQILQQSSTAMLAQANQSSQGVLKLLGG